MFEDSLFDSRATHKARRVRWAAAGAACFQALCLGLVLLVPLLHPAVLPVVSAAPRVQLIARVRPMPKPAAVKPPTLHTAAVSYAPASSAPAMTRVAGPRLLTLNPGSDSPAPTVDGGLLHMGDGGGGGGNALAAMGGPAGPAVLAVPRPAPAAPRRLAVSSGVLAGLLLGPITPAYPPIAKAAHIEGTVVLRATIDRNGRIKDLEVLSGPEMLRGSAVDAVARARYQPYRLNGDPTEVETTVSVNFRLGS